MRGYLAMTATEVLEFIETRTFDVSDIYAPTAVFLSNNSELDEEEIEYTLSMVAAEDAIDLKAESSGSALVLAFEIPESMISESHEMSISLTTALSWDHLECAFEVSDDCEELTWFATQEISQNIQDWLG
ncbi:MAG: hypothetical protein F2768_04360 [Actinobacteria bacterium]|uniref:Unannotated protein n=1 Tax=freshwater metagenome TaxID=449393 RepID=A0A6J7BEW5_9ZZZZ|nr:hypothetical protein [Actinomycetota bacterium]